MVILWILLGILIIGLVTFLIIWFYLAPRNYWFTFVEEGRAKIVVRGDKFEKALIQWTGHTFDYQKKVEEDKWNVIEGKEKWHPFGGLRYYGFWPIKALYSYRFQWTGVTEDGIVQHHPKEWLDYVLLKDDVYYFEVKQAEDRNLLPLDFGIVITLRVINPYKALFKIQNWLETVINRTQPAIRDIVGEREFKEMIAQEKELSDAIKDDIEKRGLFKEFREDYGIEIKKTQIRTVSPPDDYLQAALKKSVAERERERIVIEADAEKQKLKTIAEGESLRIKTIYEEIQKFGDLGKLVRTLEAVEKSPLAASVTVQAIPGLQEILKGIFGETPESIGEKEIKELREIIKKLSKKKKGS